MELNIFYAKLKQDLHINPTDANLASMGKYIYVALTGLTIINLVALIALWLTLTFHPSLLLIVLTLYCAQFINRHAATGLYQETHQRARVLLAGSALALIIVACNLLSMWLDVLAPDPTQMHNLRHTSYGLFIFASSLVILPCINLSLKSFSQLAQNLTQRFADTSPDIGQQLFTALHLFILVPGTGILLYLQPPQNSFAAFNLIGFCLFAFVMLVVYRHKLWYRSLLSKTQIFVPWAIYFFPYCFLLTQYAGHFWNFYLPTSLTQPNAPLEGITTTIEINLVWLIVIDLLTALVLIRGLNYRWRKSLNEVNLDKPETLTYIDHQAFAATINNYIRFTRSNAVIGITGVRGAGKSALMRQVALMLHKDYKVIQMDAPNDNQDMAFMVSICRNLCQNIIRNTRYLLFDDQDPEQQSRIRTSRQLSLLLGLTLTLGISTLLYLKHKENNFLSISNQQQVVDLLAIEQDLPILFYKESPTDEQDNSPDSSSKANSQNSPENSPENSFVSFDQDNLQQKFSHIVQREKTITDNLLRQIKQFKPSDEWPDGQKIQLNFGIPGLGYSLNILQSTRVYQDKHPSPLSYQDMEEKLIDTGAIDIENSDLNYNFHYIDNQNLSVTEQALWPYIHYVMTGGPTLIFSSHDSFYFDEDINVLDLITYHVLISNYENKLLKLSEFPQISQDFRGLLGMQAYVQDYQQKPAHYLLTWILAETLTNNKRAIVFSQPQLQRFELLLNQYQSLLKNGKSRTLEQADSKRLTFKYWYDLLREASPLKQYPHLEFFIAFLILMLWIGPFLWRYLDQLFRALANPAASALLRGSEQLLDTLSYKSNFDQSAGLSNSWFSFSRSVNKQERELNLPALTNLFANYVTVLTKHYQGKLIIVIDDLDKIHDVKQVECLLSEIKGALSVPNCYFVIALGEDCAQSFRQNRCANLDLFESNFDEVFHVTQINLQSVKYLMDNIVIAEDSYKLQPLDEASYSVIYLYCAGLAREIMRTLKLIYSDSNLSAELSATNIANYLLTKAWQNWHFELEELPIDGQTMTDLFNLTCHSGKDFCVNTLKQDLVIIDKAIDRIDSNNKRQTLLWNEQDSDNPQLAQFKTRIGATRSLVKLKLMTLLNLWVANGLLDQLTEQQHKNIVECFSQLEQQPYLAETLVEKLGSQIAV